VDVVLESARGEQNVGRVYSDFPKDRPEVLRVRGISTMKDEGQASFVNGA